MSLVRASLVACALLLLGGCFGSKAATLCTGTNCVITSKSPVDALVTAVSAGALFAAVGCTWNGCEFPYECNATTKRCERMSCSETKPCPSPYNCDFDKHKCW